MFILLLSNEFEGDASETRRLTIGSLNGTGSAICEDSRDAQRDWNERIVGLGLSKTFKYSKISLWDQTDASRGRFRGWSATW